jgi:hypothetical protein
LAAGEPSQPLETIFAIDGEGESLELRGAQREDGEWVFTKRADCGTLYDMIGESAPAIVRSNVVVGWDAALRLVGGFQFMSPRRCSVHFEFRERIWAHVSAHARRCRKGFVLRAWREECVHDMARVLECSGGSLVLLADANGRFMIDAIRFAEGAFETLASWEDALFVLERAGFAQREPDYVDASIAEQTRAALEARRSLTPAWSRALDLAIHPS